jgi:hypothetical protein
VVALRNQRHCGDIAVAGLVAILVDTAFYSQQSSVSCQLHVLDNRAAVQPAFFGDR